MCGPSEPRRCPPRLPGNSVFLVGFMGAGKSSVGRALGQRLNWIFEDLDDRIQAREGRTVAEIFRDSGESEFRRAEHAALRACARGTARRRRENRRLGRRRLRAERKCGPAEGVRRANGFSGRSGRRIVAALSHAGSRKRSANVRCCEPWSSFASSTKRGARATRRRL